MGDKLHWTVILAYLYCVLIPVIASVGAPILAIIAVIAIGKLLVAHWDEIKAVGIQIWNAAKEFFAGLWEGIKQTASAAWTAIQTVKSLNKILHADINDLYQSIRQGTDLMS